MISSAIVFCHGNLLLSITFFLKELTLNVLMDSSIWFNTINLEWAIVHIQGSYVIISK